MSQFETDSQNFCITLQWQFYFVHDTMLCVSKIHPGRLQISLKSDEQPGTVVSRWQWQIWLPLTIDTERERERSRGREANLASFLIRVILMFLDLDYGRQTLSPSLSRLERGGRRCLACYRGRRWWENQTGFEYRLAEDCCAAGKLAVRTANCK